MTGPKIVGESVLTADQLVGWYRSVAPDGALGGAKLRTIAGHYIAVGDKEGVRGDLAFIQAVHETGYFTNSDTRINNFAGIGHYDNASSGFGYPSVEAGVMAHVQLLKKVARGNDVKLRTHPEYAPNWGGAHVATWAGLAGNWATDPRYWTSLSSMYRGARRYARAHPDRAAGLGLHRNGEIRPWRFPKGANLAVGGNPARLKQLATSLGGYLETVELVFRRCRAARDELGMRRLDVGDRRAEAQLRRRLAHALDDWDGLRRIPFLLSRDIGYVVESRARLLAADVPRSERSERLAAARASGVRAVIRAMGEDHPRTRRYAAALLRQLYRVDGHSRSIALHLPGWHPRPAGDRRMDSSSRWLDRIELGRARAGTTSIARHVKGFMVDRGLAVTSELRDTKYTADGNISDHWVGNRDTYAVDFGSGSGNAVSDDDARALARKLGISGAWSPGSYTRHEVTIDGREYSVQLLWRVPGHFDHIHIGIRPV